MSLPISWPVIGGESFSIPTTAEEGWQALTDFLVALAGAQSVTAQVTATRIATTSPVTIVSASDCAVVVNLGTPGASTVNLPVGVVGQYFRIIDGKRDSGTNAITIVPNGSQTINGAASYVLNADGSSVELTFSGSGNWVVVATAGFPASSLPSGINATKIADGSVTNTEFQFLDGVSANIQTALDSKAIGAGSSVNDELVLFSGTGGKSLKSASGSGLAKLTGGVLSLVTTLSIADGGTGETDANAALNALLPDQALNNGKVLATNGTDAVWAAALTSTLADGTLFVGNASNVATGVPMTGDITMDNTGLTAIGAGKVTNAMLAGSIAITKLAAFTSAQLLALCSDETGTGSLVFSAAPTLTGAVILGAATSTPFTASSSFLNAPLSNASATVSDAGKRIVFNVNSFNTSLSGLPTRVDNTGTLGGVNIQLLARTSDSSDALNVRTNLAADGPTSEAQIVFRISQAGAVTLGSTTNTMLVSPSHIVNAAFSNTNSAVTDSAKRLIFNVNSFNSALTGLPARDNNGGALSGAQFQIFARTADTSDAFTWRTNSISDGNTGAEASLVMRLSVAGSLIVGQTAGATTPHIFNGNTTTPSAVIGSGVSVDVIGHTLKWGSDAAAVTRTDATAKQFRIMMPHYLNAEEDHRLIFAQSGNGTTAISYGGGSTLSNAVTSHTFFVAATNATLTGSAALHIDALGVHTIGITSTTPTHAINTLTATTATAGGLAAVPATVAGYITMVINGTSRKIPYFAT